MRAAPDSLTCSLVFQEATADPDRMLFLLRHKLDGAALPGPVQWLQISLAEFCGERGRQEGFFAQKGRRIAQLDEAIRQLRALGITPVMVSGDREEVARAVAGELGIERVHAGVRPTEKAAIVAAERTGATAVTLAGDGAKVGGAAEGGDVRSRPGDECSWCDGRALRRDCQASARFHPVQLRER